MAPLNLLDEGSIVRTKNGQDGVVLAKWAFPGWEMYSVLIIDTGKTERHNGFQLELVDTLDIPVEFEVPEAAAPVMPPPAAPIDCTVSTGMSTKSSGRFATIESDSDVDQLADSRLSKATKRQNEWAVRVFRGKPELFVFRATR